MKWKDKIYTLTNKYFRKTKTITYLKRLRKISLQPSLDGL